MQVTKRVFFHREGRSSQYWYILGIHCKTFYWIPLFTMLLLFYVFEVGKAKSATQSVLMILTLNGLFQKNFQVFYFTPENSISLILTPFSLCLFFSIIVFVLWFLTATILLIQTPLPILSHKNTLLQLKINIWSYFEIKNFYFPIRKISILKS